MSTTRVCILLLASGLVAAGLAGTGAGADDPLKEKALKLNDLDTTEKLQEQLTALVKDKDGTKKLVKEAVKHHRAAKGGDKPFNLNAALVLAKAAHAVKDYDAAETFYQYLSDTAPKQKEWERAVQGYEGLLDLFWDQKNYTAAEEVARKFVDLRGGEEVESAKPYFLEKLVQSKARQEATSPGSIDEAMRMAEGLANLDEGGWFFLQLKGWVQREAGKIKEAIATYKEVVERIDEAKGLKEDARTRLKRNTKYLLTGLYVDVKEIDKAADLLKGLIKDDPENPTFYNDLGFIWADHDLNIDESEKLVRQALELDAKQRKKLLEEGKIDAETAARENAAYLDSMGWVLFKQKKYGEALTYLEKAAKDEEEGNHLEIWDHWADALVALGRKKEAVEVWQKALRFEDVSPRDKERRKQVTQKMNKVKAELAK